MKKNRAERTFSLITLAALVLGCTVMMVPLRAEAARPAVDQKRVWTAIEAEIARQHTEGVPLRTIINNAVKSGEKIHSVVAACIMVGVEPSRVVYIAIAEGYAAQTVVKAARKAGAPLNAVVNSATHAGVDERSNYVADIVKALIKTGEDPSLVVYTAIIEGYSATTVVRGALKAGVPLESVMKSAEHAGPGNKSAFGGDVVTAAIKAGEDPSQVVYTAIAQGYPAQSVVRAALKAGAPVETVVYAATDAGADNKSVYVGAAEAGASPSAVERALANSRTSSAAVFTDMPTTAAASPAPAPAPAPVIFGRGGIVLSQAPAWVLPTLPLGPLMINPFLSVSETFSDNITYSQNNELSDAITTITPGLRLQLPFQAHVAELEYYSVIARYGKYDAENINDHHVGGSVDVRVGDRLELRLSDNYDRGHETRSSTPARTNEIFYSNVAAFSASNRLTDSLTARIDLERTDWRFITSHFRDREEGQIAGTVFYRVLPEASVFVEYGHRNIAYADDASDLNSTVGTMQAGLTWEFSSRSKGTLKAGLAQKDFISYAGGSGTVKVGSADVRHEFDSDTTVVLTAQRSLNEPNIPGINYFISTGAYAELTQRFFQTWTAVVRGAFVQDLNFSRIDRTALGGAGIRYRALDWLELAFDFNQQDRQSTAPGNDYTEQSSIIMATILM